MNHRHICSRSLFFAGSFLSHCPLLSVSVERKRGLIIWKSTSPGADDPMQLQHGGRAQMRVDHCGPPRMGEEIPGSHRPSRGAWPPSEDISPQQSPEESGSLTAALVIFGSLSRITALRLFPPLCIAESERQRYIGRHFPRGFIFSQKRAIFEL